MPPSALDAYVGSLVDILVGHSATHLVRSARLVRAEPAFIEVETGGQRARYPLAQVRSVDPAA